MSRNMRKLLIVILVFILLASFGMIIYENRKTNDNLPSLERTLLMEEGEADSKVKGYMEHQLLDVWGKPQHSDSETMVWILTDGALMTRSNAQGKVEGCKLKRMGELPRLEELGVLSGKETNNLLPGYFAEQLTEAWGEPEDQKVNTMTWKLPEGSAHKTITVETKKWGMVSGAEFTD